jgi:hypothetical protein
MKQDTFDYTQYRNGGASQGEPQRPSTIHELAVWMNKMSSSIGSGVYHWVTESKLHFMITLDDNIMERGLL